MLLVAHDVNPILGYLDRVVYFAGGGAVEGAPRRGDRRRDAQPPLRRADRGAARPPTAASSSSAPPEPPRPPRRPPRPCCTELAALSWNPVSDFEQLTDFPFMVNALRGGHDRRRDGRRDRLVHGPAPPDLRRPHPLGDRLPRRGRRRRLAGLPIAARLLRRLRRSARSALAARRRLAQGALSGESAAIGTVQAFALGARLPLRQPLPRPARRARRRCSSAPSSASPPARWPTLLWVAVAARRARRRCVGTAAALRLGRRRRRPRRRGADRAARLRLPARCSGWRSPRPARSPARCSSSRCWSRRRRPRSRSPPRPGLGLALSVALALAVTWLGLGDRLLLALPGRLLGDDALLRPLRRGARAGALCRGPRPRDGRGAGLMFAHEFMRNAFLAGTFVALACGLVGYFVVLRSQVFAGDALSHVAFTGALAAAAAGIDIRLGLFVGDDPRSAIGMGAARRARPPRRRRDRLRLRLDPRPRRALPLDLHQRLERRRTAPPRVRVLFGSILGLSHRRRPARRGDRDSRLAGAARDRPAAAVRLARPRGGARPRRAGAGARPRLLRPPRRSSPRRRRRRSARCCCSASSRRRAARRGCSPTTPGAASALSAAIAVGSMWVGLALSYRGPLAAGRARR